MSLPILVSKPFCYVSTRFHATPPMAPIRASSLVKCDMAPKICDQLVTRRSANYQTSIWQEDYFQSLRSDYTMETCTERVEKLKGEVKIMLGRAEETLDRLELIDEVQRLGLGYHFEEEINNMVCDVYNCSNKKWRVDLYSTALEFRLLRQHGYHVPQDVFDSFVDKVGSFNECHNQDVKGMLSLYEASYYGLEDESIMDEALKFTTKYLKHIKEDADLNLWIQVTHALELPLHWRATRLEARWSIDMYESRGIMNPIVELAKLDFNVVQGIHQGELKELSRWWKNIGIKGKLNFARDRIVESFLWSLGITFEPQFRQSRIILTKVIQLLTVTDDIYDVYGTLDELELFTDVIERWDINAMEQLPDYMKIGFLSLFNTVNEIVYDILIQQGLDVLPNLKHAWTNLCRSYLVESKWYYAGYKPTLEEYMSNAWISVGSPLVSLQAYLCTTNPIVKEELEYLESNPPILHSASSILRFCDDLGTSTDEVKRGDVSKSIQCYMNETGVSEEVARQQIMNLTRDMWKKANRLRVEDSPLTRYSVEIILNIARMSHFMYRHRNRHGGQDFEGKETIVSMVVKPVPI